LVGEVVDSGGDDCQPQDLGIHVDLYPLAGYAVINSGFTYIARNENGDVVQVGPAHRRSITILEEYIQDVDFDSISLELLDPVFGIPLTINEGKTLEPLASGGYKLSAVIRKTGRYVVVGREVVDRVPPITEIAVTGDGVSGEPNTYRDSVVVTLTPRERGEIKSGILDTRYSVDCGRNWTLYEEPFTVTLDTPHTCGEGGGVGLQGIAYGPNDFIILAMSEDKENNIEQPPAQLQFTIQ
jgi:hypothetical protein